MKRVIKTLLILIVLGSNIGCDQISKNAVRQMLEYNEQISLIHNYVTLTKIENSGAFLSLGDAWPQYLKISILTILPLIALGVAFIYLMTKKNLSTIRAIAICFIIGGGVGNLYDRIVYGSVTDFMHIDFVIFQTGIFNIADVSIMMGLIMILFERYINQIKLKSNPDNYRVVIHNS